MTPTVADMTLEDYFAGQVIVGLMGNALRTTDGRSIVDQAYDIAGRMVATRAAIAIERECEGDE